MITTHYHFRVQASVTSPANANLIQNPLRMEMDSIPHHHPEMLIRQQRIRLSLRYEKRSTRIQRVLKPPPRESHESHQFHEEPHVTRSARTSTTKRHDSRQKIARKMYEDRTILAESLWTCSHPHRI